MAVRLPVAPRALVLAAAIPLLFLHAEFQPSVSVTLAGTSVTAYLTDFAIAAVVVTALVAAVRGGLPLLRPGLPLWIVAAGFFAWLAFAVAWGHHRTADYPTATHAVTAMKFLEYALLAPAVVLLLRTRTEVLAALWSLTLWSCAATAVGVAEFFGAHVAATGTVGHRQASFLSSADFAALSSAVLLVGLLGIGVARLRLPRRLALVALATGVIGTIVAGAVASALGLATAMVVVAIALAVRGELRLRAVVQVAALGAVTLLGVVAIRGSDLTAFAHFLGASSAPATRPAKVQTYAHRTLLVWIGYEMWKDHPLLGVGWEGSAEPVNFEPYLPAAHRNFPDEAPLAFPSRAPGRQYGVQNVWVQALADLGVLGCLLWAAIFAAAAWLAVRGDVLLALAWIALLAWLWSAQGFIAGIPLDALTWLAFGLAATRVREA